MCMGPLALVNTLTHTNQRVNCMHSEIVYNIKSIRWSCRYSQLLSASPNKLECAFYFNLPLWIYSERKNSIKVLNEIHFESIWNSFGWQGLDYFTVPLSLPNSRTCLAQNRKPLYIFWVNSPDELSAVQCNSSIFVYWFDMDTTS